MNLRKYVFVLLVPSLVWSASPPHSPSSPLPSSIRGGGRGARASQSPCGRCLPSIRGIYFNFTPHTHSHTHTHTPTQKKKIQSFKPFFWVFQRRNQRRIQVLAQAGVRTPNFGRFFHFLFLKKTKIQGGWARLHRRPPPPSPRICRLKKRKKGIIKCMY